MLTDSRLRLIHFRTLKMEIKLILILWFKFTVLTTRLIKCLIYYSKCWPVMFYFNFRTCLWGLGCIKQCIKKLSVTIRIWISGECSWLRSPLSQFNSFLEFIYNRSIHFSIQNLLIFRLDSSSTMQINMKNLQDQINFII